MRHTHNSVNKDLPDGLKKLSMGWSESFDGDRVYSHEIDGDLDKIADFTDQSFNAILADSGTR
jgi:hypothetical protein